MRLVLGFVVGVAAATLAALILGEYQFTGAMPYAAGVAFGLVVGEVVATVARRRGPLVGVAAGVMGAVGMVWAAWISSGRDWSYVPSSAWAGAGLAVIAALAWVGRPQPAEARSDGLGDE